MQSQSSFTRRFWTVNLDYAAFRITPDSNRDVEADRACRNGLESLDKRRPIPQSHDRAFAELLLDVLDREFERFAFIGHDFVPGYLNACSVSRGNLDGQSFIAVDNSPAVPLVIGQPCVTVRLRRK
jgi:hypothetical protein